jgi:hypothetical protein
MHYTLDNSTITVHNAIEGSNEVHLYYIETAHEKQGNDFIVKSRVSFGGYNPQYLMLTTARTSRAKVTNRVVLHRPNGDVNQVFNFLMVDSARYITSRTLKAIKSYHLGDGIGLMAESIIRLKEYKLRSPLDFNP